MVEPCRHNQGPPLVGFRDTVVKKDDPFEACQAPATGVTTNICDDDQPETSNLFDFEICFNLEVKTVGHAIWLKTWNLGTGLASEEIVKTDEDEILVSCKKFSQISRKPKFNIAQPQNKTGVSNVISDVHKFNQQCRSSTDLITFLGIF